MKISIDKVPKWIESKETKQGDMRIVLQGFLMKYNFCVLVYENSLTQQEITVRLKIPVNTLMFCSPLDFGPAEFKEKLIELAEKKAGGIFELDRMRINSISKLREVLLLEGAIKVYPQIDNLKGRIFAGTKLDDNFAIIQIDVTPSNPPQCVLNVYSSNEIFRSVVAVTICDMLGKSKS